MGAGESLFSGVRVLELGHVIAAPFAANLLGDFGAEVIKVEDPGAGDMMRKMGFAKEGQYLWWRVAARNKKSVTLDLRSQEGQGILRRLASRVDVIIENFRPGTLEKWGIGWRDLSAENPRLIMLRISGYGQEGPERAKAGFGKAGEAMSGAVYISGFPDKPPTHWGFSLGDLSTGLMGAFAVAGALYRREAAGTAFRGECVDLALYETLFRLIEWQVVHYDQLGFVPERKGNQYPLATAAISNTHRTKDGRWITFATATGRAVTRVLQMIGGEALAKEARFATYEGQLAHEQELDSLVRDWVAKRSAAEVLQMCENADVVAAPILNAAEIADHPTFRARENIVEVEDPQLGRLRMTGIVPRLTNYPGTVQSTGPDLGANNEEIYVRWLGMPETELRDLHGRRII